MINTISEEKLKKPGHELKQQKQCDRKNMFPTERGRKRLCAHLKLSIFSSLFLPQAAAEGTETLTIFVRICIQS